jgi:hypothetical protein
MKGRKGVVAGGPLLKISCAWHWEQTASQDCSRLFVAVQRTTIKCCFGFPKQPSATHWSENGWRELPRRAGGEWVSEWCLTSVIEMEAHSHIRVIESNDEDAIAYVLGYCLKREGATRFVDTTNEVGRVLSTCAVSVSLETYMLFSNWRASVSVKVQSIPLIHPPKETVSFRKLTSDGVVICGLNPTRQSSARAPSSRT